MNLQNIPGNMNLHFVDKKFFRKKKRLHVALEYISKLKKNICGGRVWNGTEMKFDEHILFLSLFPRPQHLKAAGHCDNTDS